MESVGGGDVTRRRLITGAVAVGLVSDAGAPSAAAATQPESDVQLLQDALSAEQLAVFCYGWASSGGLPAGRTRHLARSLLAAERAHAARLAQQITALGGTPAAARTDAAAAQKLLTGHGVSFAFTATHTERETVALLVRIEALLVHYYYEAIVKLTDAGLVEPMAEVMAAEAQHSTLLVAREHPHELYKAVPFAFEEGSP